MKKTFRVQLKLEGDPTTKIYRTDGNPTHCCSFQTDFFCWEKNTKYNDYNGWSGYVSQRIIANSLKEYNPDNLEV